MAISNSNLLPSQQAAVLGVIKPDAQTVGTKTSGWIDMSKFSGLMVLIISGVLGAAATLDAKIQQATDATGTGAKDVTGKAITQMTKAADDNKQSIINLFADDLDSNNNFTHVRISMTIATATSDASATALGFYPHYGPASDNQAVSVIEIVV